ncbi:TPA: polysaccharide pyruvyl transferase family protein [Photobacterium damselae]
MKKIGIITFHRAHNYGAVLQAYALEKAIKKLGYDVGFIDSQNEIIREAYTLFPKFKLINFEQCFRKCLHLVLDFKRKHKRYHEFENFISENLSTISVKNQFITFDSVVLGSDQIWNHSYTNGFDNLYFGISDEFKANKRISYAASMGKSELNEELMKDFKAKLNEINEIGVREETLKDYIQENIGFNSEVNLDPTLLLDKDDWLDVCSENNQSGDYLLVYEVQSNPITMDIVDYISKQTGLMVVVLSAKTDFRMSKNYITDASPKEFVSLFRHASYVVTTSFHGTVFSIINNVPFTTVAFNNEIDIRSKSLLDKIGLSSRMIGCINEVDDIDLEQDFNSINKKLSILKNNSLRYLSNAIK